MNYQNYRSLKIQSSAGVAFVMLDHPPINLLDEALVAELERFRKEVQGDDDVNVVVFGSANPEFFIAHYDLEVLIARQRPRAVKAATLKPFHTMLERYRTLPKVTIAKIEGRARGGGSEFLLALDMRFAAIGRALLAQPEVALGIIPGGGGTQYLPRLVGRSRALEIIMGADAFDAELAERYGWVNRALAADEIGPFVDRLARRIASFPADAIRMAKESVFAAVQPLHDGLCEEAYLFDRATSLPEAVRRMKLFLAAGGQTRQGELDLESAIGESLETFAQGGGTNPVSTK